MALFMLKIPAYYYQIRTNPPSPTNICCSIPARKIPNGFYKGGALLPPLYKGEVKSYATIPTTCRYAVASRGNKTVARLVG